VSDVGSEETESLLSLAEIAKQLNSPLYLVRKIAESLEGRVITAKKIPGKKMTSRRKVYDPQEVREIGRRVERTKLRREHANDLGAVYWESLGALWILARTLGKLSTDVDKLYARLRRHPPSVAAFISTLPDERLSLLGTLGVLVSPLRRTYWRASWIEAGLTGQGRTQEEAVLALREEIGREYHTLKEDPSRAPERWLVLDELIAPRKARRKRDLGAEGQPDEAPVATGVPEEDYQPDAEPEPPDGRA
jgi:hypothetical protein